MKQTFLSITSYFSIKIRYFNFSIMLIFLVMASGLSVNAEEQTAEEQDITIEVEDIDENDGYDLGVFVGSFKVKNKTTDVDGFANWGQKGWTVKHNRRKFFGGFLAGKKINVNGVPLRLELDGTFGNIPTKTKMLDPEGLDETVRTKVKWVATVRVGLEEKLGLATVFANGGLAIARVSDSVIDIDFGPNRATAVDPDDSFRDNSFQLGWVLGAGIELPLGNTAWDPRDRDSWKLRLEASYFDLGERKHTVNHSGGNRCGPGGPHRPCVYRFKTKGSFFRIAIFRRLFLL